MCVSYRAQRQVMSLSRIFLEGGGSKPCFWKVYVDLTFPRKVRTPPSSPGPPHSINSLTLPFLIRYRGGDVTE